MLEIDFISVFQFLIVFVMNARVHNCYFSIKAAQHFKLHRHRVILSLSKTFKQTPLPPPDGPTEFNNPRGRIKTFTVLLKQQMWLTIHVAFSTRLDVMIKTWLRFLVPEKYLYPFSMEVFESPSPNYHWKLQFSFKSFWFPSTICNSLFYSTTITTNPNKDLSK